jgi:DNA (cytosine-5)-methyltransferase 1
MAGGKKKKPQRKCRTVPTRSICGIDVFCGVGGLTRGLEKSGIDVKIGVDIDPACEFPYSANNNAEFLLKSVADLSRADLKAATTAPGYKLLAGCAPCQPFSTYRQKAGPSDERWHLLREFQRLAEEIRPDLITMENVPNLERQKIFREFVANLKRQKFHVSYEVVDCSDFGVPQQRERLVLLASKLGPITLLRPKKRQKPKTVRQAIGRLPPIKAGEVYKKDRLHQASQLSKLNLKRVRASTPGGSWRDWNKKLVAACHQRKTGKSYPGVYGRMEWNAPSPTVTTQYFGFGSGRFGHPKQDRGISLREGAILQSFPRSYKFVAPDRPVHIKTVGRLVGNAVPVKLAEAIGKSILDHVRSTSERRKKAA